MDRVASRARRRVWVALARVTLSALVACSDEPTIIGGPGAGGDGPERTPDALDPAPVDGELPAETPAPPDGDGNDKGDGDGDSNGDDDTPGNDAQTGGETEPVGPAPPEPTFVAPRGACDVADRVGSFSIEKQVDFGVVQGAVADGVVPTAVPTLVGESGGCQLLERRTLVCLPACVGAETCGEAGTCIPYPRQVSVGDVTISGLTRAATLSPLSPGNSYFAPGADNPPFVVGNQIVLSAAGAGDIGPFQLFGVGSEPFAEAPSWVLEAGAPLALEWAAPTAAVETSVLVELTIDQHGTSPLSLSCELPDEGSATIPAALIDQLIGSGVSGFPNGRITRRTADHVPVGAGCVELVVGSPLAVSVAVAGYTPCNGAEDCPSGQSCNLPLERCE